MHTTNFGQFVYINQKNLKFYPFTETEEDLLEKIREDMVVGPSIVFTREALVDEFIIRRSKNLCKSFVGIDASQLYPYSRRQPMPTGLYTKWGVTVRPALHTTLKRIAFFREYGLVISSTTSTGV